MLNFIINSFHQYNLSNLMELFTVSGLGIVFTLVILEGLLSADNAIVLAMLVKHLPENQRKKALTYGMAGAIGFRFLAIMVGTYLVKLWWIKLLGGVYLLYLALKHFISNEEDGSNSNASKGFLMTILTVEAMDIAFSADSILAAFGMSPNPWILLMGGVLGIAMMRTVAKMFIVLLEKIPELANAAYVLILIIGAKMSVAALWHYELSHTVFFGLMALVFGGTIALHYLKKPSTVISERV